MEKTSLKNVTLAFLGRELAARLRMIMRSSLSRPGKISTVSGTKTLSWGCPGTKTVSWGCPGTRTVSWECPGTKL